MKLLNTGTEKSFVPFTLNIEVESDEDAALLACFFNASLISGSTDIFSYVTKKFPEYQDHILWSKMKEVFHSALFTAKI